jgi:hypothetical protein
MSQKEKHEKGRVMMDTGKTSPASPRKKSNEKRRRDGKQKQTVDSQTK